MRLLPEEQHALFQPEAADVRTDLALQRPLSDQHQASLRPIAVSKWPASQPSPITASASATYRRSHLGGKPPWLRITTAIWRRRLPSTTGYSPAACSTSIS